MRQYFFTKVFNERFLVFIDIVEDDFFKLISSNSRIQGDDVDRYLSIDD